MSAQARHPDTSVIVTLGRDILSQAQSEGLVARLEASGVRLIPDLCWCSIVEPCLSEGRKDLDDQFRKVCALRAWPQRQERAVRQPVRLVPPPQDPVSLRACGRSGCNSRRAVPRSTSCVERGLRFTRLRQFGFQTCFVSTGLWDAKESLSLHGGMAGRLLAGIPMRFRLMSRHSPPRSGARPSAA